MIGNIAVSNSGNRLYFVCQNSITKENWIYFFDDNGGRWDFISPSYFAELTGSPLRTVQVPSDISGDIAVSPDGSTIAYWGRKLLGGWYFPFVYYFHTDGVNFFWHPFDENPITLSNINSLHFTGNGELFYVVDHLDINRIVYQEDYCNNRNVKNYP